MKNVWSLAMPGTEWVMGYEVLLFSHLSLEYVIIPVNVTKAGVSYNPTSDTLQFAFMPTPTQIPGTGDWVTGIWESDSSNVLYPYSAKCLVGPGGVSTLGVGTYVIYLKITDSPEIPVLVAGQLVINLEGREL